MWREEIISCSTFTEKIESWFDEVYEAQARNFTKWPILGSDVVVDWNAGPRYEDEINVLSDWICQRIQWMDGAPPELILDHSNTNVKVHPNLNQGTFNVEIRSANNGPRPLSIYTMTGALVYEENINTTLGLSTHPIAIPNPQTGMYILKIEGEKGVKLFVN